VSVRQGSQDDAAFLTRMSAEHGPFDIVIDDGSHVPAQVIASFDVLFPLLADGGLYVIEDVQTTFWPDFGGAPDGGGIMQLGRAILEHVNHAEIQVAQPTIRSPIWSDRFARFTPDTIFSPSRKGTTRSRRMPRSDPTASMPFARYARSRTRSRGRRHRLATPT